MALKLWHHVHVVNPEWHDAAPRYEFVQSGQGDSALSHVNILAEDPRMLSDWYQRHMGGESRACEFASGENRQVGGVT